LRGSCPFAIMPIVIQPKAIYVHPNLSHLFQKLSKFADIIM
jgi:hypothetical protein